VDLPSHLLPPNCHSPVILEWRLAPRTASLLGEQVGQRCRGPERSSATHTGEARHSLIVRHSWMPEGCLPLRSHATGQPPIRRMGDDPGWRRHHAVSVRRQRRRRPRRRVVVAAGRFAPPGATRPRPHGNRPSPAHWDSSSSDRPWRARIGEPRIWRRGSQESFRARLGLDSLQSVLDFRGWILVVLQLT
jgi:hypothetical protein